MRNLCSVDNFETRTRPVDHSSRPPRWRTSRCDVLSEAPASSIESFRCYYRVGFYKIRGLLSFLAFLAALPVFAQPWSGAATGGATLEPYAITNANIYDIACYGDSLTLGAFGGTTVYPLTLSLLTHRFTQNYGVSGYTSGQISTAFLADSNNYGTYLLWSGRNNYTASATNPPFNANPWCSNQVFNDICYDANWCATNGPKLLSF
jgi:hypothetical protein